MKEAPSRLRRWMRDALTTGLVLLVVAVFLAGGLTQEWLGTILGGLCLGGAVWLTAVPVAEESPSRRVAWGMYAFAAIWAASAILPFYRMMQPGRVAASAQLPPEGAPQSLGDLEGGVYTVVARTSARGVPGQVGYRVAFLGGTEHAEVRGQFYRNPPPQPGAPAAVKADNRHEVRLPRGPVRAKIDKLDGALTAPLELQLYRSPLSHRAQLGIEIAIVIAAAVLDALFATRKRKSTLAVGALFALVFLEAARTGVSPSNTVRPLLGAAGLAVVVGAVVGYPLGLVARQVAGAVRRRV